MTIDGALRTRTRAPSLRRWLVLAWAAVVLLVALGTRLQAVGTLGIDFDEDDYLRAGQLYATGLQAGDPGVFLRENYRAEHPQLSKIVIGLAIAPLPAAPEIEDVPTTAPPARDLPEPHLTVARTVNAVLGALAAAVVALVSPLGGLAFAFHTYSIKYSSQVMLEAAPALCALLAVVFAARAWRTGDDGRRDGGRSPGRPATRWMVAAAIAFGLACAGKYLYGVAGLAILADWVLHVRAANESRRDRLRELAPMAGFVALAIGVFLLANPYLWPDPIGRLAASIGYHAGYATSDAVSETGWPAWQPLVWLAGSVPVGWQDPGTFVVAIDLLITALAVTGARRLWREHRVWALWLLLALVFLVLWPTKWPQYVLMLSAPLCLSAGLGAESLLGRLVRRPSPAPLAGGAVRSRTERAGRALRDLRTAMPWLVPGIVGLTVLAIIPLVYEWLLSLTDMRLSSMKDGLSGGVLRESIGGITGAIAPVPFDTSISPHVVRYVGLDLLSGVQQGFWLGGQTSAAFIAFSVLWMVLAVGMQAAVGIAVALVLERPGVRFAGAWRTLFILPWAVPEVVAAIAWRDLVHPSQGLVAQALGSPFPWPASPELSLLVLLVAGTWMGFPLWMLVATAGLRTIPRSVDEAAELDGAGRWRRFTGITLPLLLPLLGAAFIVRGIATFNQFYLFWVLEPNGNTTTVSTFAYQLVRGDPFYYSLSAAVNVVTVIALAVVVAWFLRWRSSAERLVLA